jgi:plastocyanin
MSGFPNIPESPFFKPSILVGSPGERIRLTIANRSLVPFTHNFTWTSEKVNHDIPWKRSYVVTVTFPESGVLFFYCKYHVGLGQVGELQAR